MAARRTRGTIRRALDQRSVNGSGGRRRWTGWQRRIGPEVVRVAFGAIVTPLIAVNVAPRISDAGAGVNSTALLAVAFAPLCAKALWGRFHGVDRESWPPPPSSASPRLHERPMLLSSASPAPSLPSNKRGGRNERVNSPNSVSRIARPVLTGFALLLIAVLADSWAYEHVVVGNVYDEDWGRLLRVMGFWPLWLLLSFALVLHDRPLGVAGVWRGALARGWLLVSAVTLSGIAGELLKLLFRRERPRAHGGEYVFRAFTERPFSSSGLALPSSHAVIAFGAAAMLSRLFPRAAPVWWLLAIGCALTRVMAQAHFVSDVVVSFLVGWLVVAWLWRVSVRKSVVRSDAEVGSV